MNKTIFTLLTGVLIGVLLAPDNGSETLKKLRTRLKEYKDDASDQATDLASKGKDIFQSGRTQAGESPD
jgi:gas vesicle protein